jgi:PAS domain-containing protein
MLSSPSGSRDRLCADVALPGALVYTDEDLNIVICNDRFKEMYRVPEELLQAGRPYPDFLRYLAVRATSTHL